MAHCISATFFPPSHSTDNEKLLFIDVKIRFDFTKRLKSFSSSPNFLSYPKDAFVHPFHCQKLPRVESFSSEGAENRTKKTFFRS
jgi:hypothetical protein